MRQLTHLQLSVVNVANVKVLPVPMLPMPNWSLELDIGNTGNISTFPLHIKGKSGILFCRETRRIKTYCVLRFGGRVAAVRQDVA